MTSSKLLTAMCLVFMSCTILYSCKKQMGLQGEKGDSGIAGPAGSTVLSGNAVPATSIGAVGDFYLDLSTSKFYGPKKPDGSWGTGFSMLGANGIQGPAGQNGANGSNGTNGNKILNGSGAPAANIGAVNDYYLDKTSYTLYGPKLTAGWGIGVSLKGPAGTSGIMYSGWQYAKAFSDTTIDNSKLKVGYITAKSISTSVLNSGTILVYFTYGGGVMPLPYTSFAGGKSNIINFMPLFNRIVITRFTADNSSSVALSTLLQYRYVIIPGGSLISSLPKKDLENYELMKKKLNIPD
ncbi:hypothetical protein [Pedobacter sp. BAL39]|uniref:hypothetical protein n=1 Tax=Pedobacter sp. BAL39 TaxID=391596 RepID=UPI0005880718|nr:hypothetical protein [Pedobacter sp. BAL39]